MKILTFEEVEAAKKLLPEPSIRRLERDYGDAGAWKRTWMYFTVSNKFIIDRDWYFTLPGGQQGLIKKGFIYDGASIPFFARPVMMAFGALHRTGCIHDYGYRFNLLRDWDGDKIYVDAGKKFFDILFRNVGAYTSHLKGLAGSAWLAVKWFGKKSWEKHRGNNLTDDYLFEEQGET